MINESQSDSESTTQIAKAPNSIVQVHVSASGIMKIPIKYLKKQFSYIELSYAYIKCICRGRGGKTTINRAYYFSNEYLKTVKD
jgi:hypothetical protein